MRKDTAKWKFFKRPSRPPLDEDQATFIKSHLNKILKVGIETEINLPKQSSGCKGNNPSCSCISIYKTERGNICYTECSKKGNCSIEDTIGCYGVDCIEFSPPCPTCPKADKGCHSCSLAYDPSKNPESIRGHFNKNLKPTKFLGNIGEHGVLDVVTDGSLVNGGVEVVTVGRRFDFRKFYKMMSDVFEIAYKQECQIDNRCSIHIHLVCGYLDSNHRDSYNPKKQHYGLPSVNGPSGSPIKIEDLEEPIPEIVLSNFHQLWRRYENAIIWMTSSGNHKDHLTRWIKFRRSMLQFSAARRSMKEIIDEMKNNTGDNYRYMMVNYQPLRFTGTQAIKRLHFEIRAADGSLSAAATSAMCCLFVCMLLKSVDLSKHGIVESGTKESMEESRNLQGFLCNNDGSYSGPRNSDTSSLEPHYDTLREQGRDLLRLLRSELVNHPKAFSVLKKLVEKPCSLHLIEGKSWPEIDAHFMDSSTKMSLKKSLEKIVDLSLISDCNSLEEWVEVAAEETSMSTHQIKNEVDTMVEAGLVFWNPSVGSISKGV